MFRIFEKDLESFILFFAQVFMLANDSFAFGMIFLTEDNDMIPPRIGGGFIVSGILLECASPLNDL